MCVSMVANELSEVKGGISNNLTSKLMQVSTDILTHAISGKCTDVKTWKTHLLIQKECN